MEPNQIAQPFRVGREIIREIGPKVVAESLDAFVITDGTNKTAAGAEILDYIRSRHVRVTQYFDSFATRHECGSMPETISPAFN